MLKFVEPSKILEELFDKKTLSILRLLAGDKDRQFYLREISKLTRVPVASVYRIINKLVEMEILEVIKIKKFKLYKYGSGKSSKFVEQLIEIRKGAVEDFVDQCKNIPEIKEIVLHGKRHKDKANLLIIGLNVPTGPLIEASAKVKETYGFTIIYLMLGSEQYQQMVDMGLYAGDRQVLYEK